MPKMQCSPARAAAPVAETAVLTRRSLWLLAAAVLIFTVFGGLSIISYRALLVVLLGSCAGASIILVVRAIRNAPVTIEPLSNAANIHAVGAGSGAGAGFGINAILDAGAGDATDISTGDGAGTGCRKYAAIIVCVLLTLAVLASRQFMARQSSAMHASAHIVGPPGICEGGSMQFIAMSTNLNAFAIRCDPDAPSPGYVLAKGSGIGIMEVYAGAAHTPTQIEVFGLPAKEFYEPYGVPSDSVQFVATHVGEIYRWKVDEGDDVGFQYVRPLFAPLRPVLTPFLGVRNVSGVLLIFLGVGLSALYAALQSLAGKEIEAWLKQRFSRKQPT